MKDWWFKFFFTFKNGNREKLDWISKTDVFHTILSLVILVFLTKKLLLFVWIKHEKKTCHLKFLFKISFLTEHILILKAEIKKMIYYRSKSNSLFIVLNFLQIHYVFKHIFEAENINSKEKSFLKHWKNFS